LALVFLSASQLTAQKWQIQYFYDQAKSNFAVSDLQFSSATHGVAVGVIHGTRRDEPFSVVTSDAGEHWEPFPLKETPISLFFLNENQGWLVTAKGLWQTSTSGTVWTKLPKVGAEITRVYFLDEQHGWAIGPKKNALETRDGGKSWIHLSAATPQFGEDPDYSAYTWITFASPQRGFITGWNIPPNRNAPELPDWVNPAAALKVPDTPHSSFTLTTNDGGAIWTPASRSMLGAIARVRFIANGKGLGLMQYSETAQYPSEVYAVDGPGAGSHTVYRDAKFAVSDVWLTPDGTAYLAGTVVRGKLRSVIPEKVRVLTSKDLTNWTPIAVDYRAEALSVILSGAGDQLWMATDSGMILKLTR
jgi:photosystem II stability/assembly factor-like uncharacterized protein